MDAAQEVECINKIGKYLACQDVASLKDFPSVDCIVLCGSAILYCAETVFSTLHARPHLARTLVISGGIGHSTPYLYDAVANNPKYARLYPQVQGLPESRVLYRLFKENCDVAAISEAGCRILLDDVSTNCGGNAIETRKVLDMQGITTPQTFIIVQDPTMSRRTIASFQQTYSDLSASVNFMGCPTFVPILRINSPSPLFCTPGLESDQLWGYERYLGLILGEIPRLRDDLVGYGPSGKGYIVHVDIPNEVEEAWTRLAAVFVGKR